jgi:hypothetical protein
MNETTNSPTLSSALDESVHASAVEALQEALLRKIQQAGTTGVSIRDLDSTTRKARALLEPALAELMARGKLVRIDDGRRAYFFLAQFAPTVESVRHKVERTAREAQVTLLSRNDLSSALLPAERPFLTQVLVGLLAEKALIKLSHHGRARKGGAQREMDFYMHTSGLRELVAATYPESAPPPFTPPKLLEVYQQLVQRNGFPDVEIFELNERLGLPLDFLRAQILAEYEAGRAVLSFGDWSLASPETRSGAIEINGDRYLRVRFQDEQHADDE